MKYTSFILEQLVKIYDEFGVSLEEYEKISNVKACINTNKVYNVVEDQIYSMTQPTAIIHDRLPLEFNENYRLVDDDIVYNVVSFQTSSRFTVLELKAV